MCWLAREAHLYTCCVRPTAVTLALHCFTAHPSGTCAGHGVGRHYSSSLLHTYYFVWVHTHWCITCRFTSGSLLANHTMVQDDTKKRRDHGRIFVGWKGLLFASGRPWLMITVDWRLFSRPAACGRRPSSIDCRLRNDSYSAGACSATNSININSFRNISTGFFSYFVKYANRFDHQGRYHLGGVRIVFHTWGRLCT